MSTTEDRMYDAAQITGHCSELDASADVGMSVGLGGGRMLYIGEVSDALIAEHGAELGGTGGRWIVVFGQTREDVQILGKAVAEIDADAVCCAVAAVIRRAGVEVPA
ncbi:hypothetical protein [Methylobacterium sp. CCH5-D2]|uniref:hypothetical protein n=1 Tax=Methylobacterium sp. CCH5-D2 TaxID=1768765 RepID=UPI00082F7AAD|nr:hypothetical protein [Methylobacterium sp. CCH5-D2]